MEIPAHMVLDPYHPGKVFISRAGLLGYDSLIAPKETLDQIQGAIHLAWAIKKKIEIQNNETVILEIEGIIANKLLAK